MVHSLLVSGVEACAFQPFHGQGQVVKAQSQRPRLRAWPDNLRPCRRCVLTLRRLLRVGLALRLESNHLLVQLLLPLHEDCRRRRAARHRGHHCGGLAVQAADAPHVSCTDTRPLRLRRTAELPRSYLHHLLQVAEQRLAPGLQGRGAAAHKVTQEAGEQAASALVVLRLSLRMCPRTRRCRHGRRRRRRRRRSRMALSAPSRRTKQTAGALWRWPRRCAAGS
mmetsp:Transcript_132618/g.383397  ORF Transcript_132618/g.383397 Transcript_132618/m.383397 type:complete len:223 (+) Transcript_132618:1869-2537(+)